MLFFKKKMTARMRFMMRKFRISIGLIGIVWFFMVFSIPTFGGPAVLLNDDFHELRPGMFSAGVVGAHAEYHYVHETAPHDNWVVSCFTSGTPEQRAWWVIEEDGDAMLSQTIYYKRNHSHPMICTVARGGEFWRDYTVSVRFCPQWKKGQIGVAFRYRNDRCYYFFGMKGPKAILKVVKHGVAFRRPYEKILAEHECAWNPGEFLTATIRVEGNRIRAKLDNGVVLEAKDSTFVEGKVALTADVPARFSSVKVTTSTEEMKRVEKNIAAKEKEEARLQAANPMPVVWKKFTTAEYGVGRNLRFGDLDGDGEVDILFGQVIHHGPKDRNSELSCLTAVNLNGKVLWQKGKPDLWKNHLTNDVGFQIHDIDGDGRNEAVYCMNQEIIVAEGATGKVKYRKPTPLKPPGDHGPHNIFPRILGDSLFFCDLRGQGQDRDIIFKDRYRHIWAMNDQFEILWKGECTTGHYPFAFDIDNDGRDEIAIGYSMFDDNGTKLWSLDGKMEDHADGIAVARFKKGAEPILFCAASDAGAFFTDLKGNVLKHHFFGHVQNPAVANLRDDLPGLEIVSINFWGNQGIIHYFDSEGDLYHDFEPVQHGSMCLPINWTGKSEEFFVLSPDVTEGGMYDGRGRRVVQFPADGHPYQCNAVLDVTGDCRDEVVVWDPYELWIYTQDDNPKRGQLYKPERNPLYNYSNYQATVSLPGWAE
jgi:rhamnogalacturonan endolyase